MSFVYILIFYSFKDVKEKGSSDKSPANVESETGTNIKEKPNHSSFNVFVIALSNYFVFFLFNIWWIYFTAPLHHVASYLQAKEVQLVLDHKLGKSALLKI